MMLEINDAITSKCHDALVQSFGSYSVGLSIFLSDIDVSILGVGLDTSINNNSCSAGGLDEEISYTLCDEDDEE